MAFPVFKAGELYAARSQVRDAYREFWKGILVRDGRVGIVHAYRGLARRVHYSDHLDIPTMTLKYLGEGRKGDQQLTRANAALIESERSAEPVDVFFDCGDIQLPLRGKDTKPEKHLLAGGKWNVISHERRLHPEEGRWVYEFTLEPADAVTRATLLTLFVGESKGFEDVLTRFAGVRTELYEGFKHILRARDSIAGHVGEYFAVKHFNARWPDLPLVRVSSNFPDLDAIQTSKGRRFAVKTVTGTPQKTSNIWTPLAELPKVVDDFLVVELDPWKLQPKGLFRLPVSKAKKVWANDSYQGSGKLTVDERFKDLAEAV